MKMTYIQFAIEQDDNNGVETQTLMVTIEQDQVTIASDKWTETPATSAVVDKMIRTQRKLLAGEYNVKPMPVLNNVE